MNKTHKFKNNKVIEFIKEKEAIAKELNDMSKEWEKQDKYAKKLQIKMNRIKDKMIPLIANEIKQSGILEEFDIIQSANYDKDDVIVTIVNELELLKKQLRERNEKNNNKEQAGVNQTGGEGKEAKQED